MDAAVELDGYLDTRQVEELTGYTRRWIFEKVRQGTFPAPDIPGRLGAAHRWRRSTMKRHLAQTETDGRKLSALAAEGREPTPKPRRARKGTQTAPRRRTKSKKSRAA